MNKLSQKIENIINISIKDFIKKISENFDNVPEKRLEELWDEITCLKKGVDVEEVKKVNKEEVKKVNKEVKKDMKCPYVFSRGKRKGEICNIRLNGNKDFCSSHSKSEVKKEKVDTSISSEEKVIHTGDSEKIDNNFRILKKNKELNCLWNSYTGMVFKNSQERVVIARIKDGKKYNLNKEDIDECKKWNYQFRVDTEDEKKEDNNILNKEDIIEKSIEDILGIITDDNSTEEV